MACSLKGRCRKCSKAFCGSHRGYRTVDVDREWVTVATDLCSDCQAVAAAAAAAKSAAAEAERKRHEKAVRQAEMDYADELNSLSDPYERVLRAMSASCAVQWRDADPDGYRAGGNWLLIDRPEILDAVIPDFCTPTRTDWERETREALNGFLAPNWQTVAPLDEASFLRWFASAASDRGAPPEEVDREVTHHRWFRLPQKITVTEACWRFEGGVMQRDDSHSEHEVIVRNPGKDPLRSSSAKAAGYAAEGRLDTSGRLSPSDPAMADYYEGHPSLTTVAMMGMGSLLGYEETKLPPPLDLMNAPGHGIWKGRSGPRGQPWNDLTHLSPPQRSGVQARRSR